MILRYLGKAWGTVRSWTPEQTWKAMNLVEPAPYFEVSVMRGKDGHLHVLHPMVTCREGMAELADALGTMANVMMAQARHMPSIRQPSPPVPSPNLAHTTSGELIPAEPVANGHGG